MKPKPPSGFQLRTIPENRLAKSCISRGCCDQRLMQLQFQTEVSNFSEVDLRPKGKWMIASWAPRNVYRENMWRDLFSFNCLASNLEKVAPNQLCIYWCRWKCPYDMLSSESLKENTRKVKYSEVGVMLDSSINALGKFKRRPWRVASMIVENWREDVGVMHVRKIMKNQGKILQRSISDCWWQTLSLTTRLLWTSAPRSCSPPPLLVSINVSA